MMAAPSRRNTARPRVGTLLDFSLSIAVILLQLWSYLLYLTQLVYCDYSWYAWDFSRCTHKLDDEGTIAVDMECAAPLAASILVGTLTAGILVRFSIKKPHEYRNRIADGAHRARRRSLRPLIEGYRAIESEIGRLYGARKNPKIRGIRRQVVRLTRTRIVSRFRPENADRHSLMVQPCVAMGGLLCTRYKRILDALQEPLDSADAEKTRWAEKEMGWFDTAEKKKLRRGMEAARARHLLGEKRIEEVAIQMQYQRRRNINQHQQCENDIRQHR